MKFAKLDARYFAERERLAAKHGIAWNYVDPWPLYCGMANLSRNVAIMNLVREVLDVPGDIAEFGCYRGANLMLMAKLMHLYDPHGSKQVHGFDGFDGLQTFTDSDRDAVNNSGRFVGDYELLMDMINLYELQDDVVVHRGWIQETLPALMETRPELSFSLVYCDTDLYEPTKVILDQAHARLSKAGLIVFDEWNNPEYPGETTAVREFLDKFGDCYEMRAVPRVRNPSCVLKKVRL
jgi:hypothetical protein